MDDKHKYYPTQNTMIRWYYKIKDCSNNFIKKNFNDQDYSKSIYFSFRKICLVTNIQEDFCEIEHLAWIHKDNLIKLDKAPNGEIIGAPYFVKGTTCVIPSPGYHILSNHPSNTNGYYFIFSLYDPYY